MSNGQVPHSSFGTQTYQGRISPPPTPRLRPIPLPPTPYEGPTLHSLLTYAVPPKIAYNLLTSLLLAHPPGARARWAHEPATSPPTPSLTLRCAMLPESVYVFPSRYPHVAIVDVLLAVRNAYQRAVQAHTEDEESGLVPSFLDDSTMLSACFMWAGISDQIEPGVWLLHLEEPY